MNVQKIIPNVTTRVTELVKNGKVYEGIYATGETPILRDQPRSAEYFRELIPDLKKLRKITMHSQSEKISEFSDTYVSVVGQRIQKIVRNFKNKTITCATTMLDKNGQPIKKIVSKMINPTLSPTKLPYREMEDLVNLHREADSMYVTNFKNGKPVSNLISHQNSDGKHVRSYLLLNNKVTKYGQKIKDAAAKRKYSASKNSYQPNDNKLTTYWLNIFYKQTKNGSKGLI